jgi:hypothetical protein
MSQQFFSCLASLLLAIALTFAGVLPASAALPSNDDFASATVVTEPLPFTNTINTSEATTAPEDPDCYGNGPTVWYEYTPSQDMLIEADTFGSDYDTTLSVYTGSPGSLTQIGCEDNPQLPYGPQASQAAVIFNVVAGQTYYFMVGASGSGLGGTLVFNVAFFQNVQAEIQIDPIGTVTKNGSAIIRGTLTCSRPAILESVGGTVQQTVGKRVIIAPFFLPLSYCGPEMGVIQWEVVTSPDDNRFKPGLVTIDVDESFFDIVSDESDRVEFTQVVRLKRK